MRIAPVIPVRKITAHSPKYFPKLLYKGRARIEQAIGKLKRFKRIALRCEKTAANFFSLVSFACGLILVKSVHRT
jgi:transposase